MEFAGIYGFILSERKKKGKTSQMQASNGETKGLGVTASREYGGGLNVDHVPLMHRRLVVVAKERLKVF